MRHQSIRWILIALLLIIGMWGTILLIAYFITAPSFNDVKNLLSNQQDWVETYTQLVEAHNRQFASLAQVTLILIVPVFSTLAGSYIRGNITTV
ncbi:MAG: hypothetical protein CSA76_02360 [Spirochaetales bacterium]|nr:MAG: hypothetical protein CSA76_02360 [Spirochaetales bacterium]